jgi:hypothetical protein
MTSPSQFGIEELKSEISKRKNAGIDRYWADRIRNAKYLCPDCGMPDSSHTVDCISDTES